MSAGVVIRAARPDDTAQLYAWIVELADYERAADLVVGDQRLLHEALFGERPVAESAIAELDGEPAGFALYFTTFSTWLCLPGIWLEDLYVPPAQRRGGVGRALLNHLAQIAVTRGCGRLEWSVLHWNAPAIGFYESIGAVPLDDWRVMRLAGGALRRLAGEAG